MRLLLILLCSAIWGDEWLTRVAPILRAGEKKTYRALSNEAERESFRKAIWTAKSISEAEYAERAAHVDNQFGSGKAGSGANTDQGHLYLALGPPNSVHRVPSSRTFYETEIWYYDHAPQTGYRSRLQFLFYKPRGIGDFKLYSPVLDTIRALMVPQSGTRGMFPVNDVITPQDVRKRLNVSPGEDEIIEAALGVAKGITGTGNSEIFARAMSPAEMLSRSPQLAVRSTFAVADPVETRVIQFWVDQTIPVTDVQIRAKAVSKIAVTVGEERSEVPLGFSELKPVLFTQRFFLRPGKYTLLVEVDGVRSSIPLAVSSTATSTVSGEAFDDKPGEAKISITPDPRGAIAREALVRR